MLRSLTLLWKRAVQLCTKDIWTPSHIGEKSLRGAGYAVLRIISITITGILGTRSVARAAALSFTTMLSLGPLIALAVLIAGFSLNKQDSPDFIANKLNDVISFIAPQVDHFEELHGEHHHGMTAPPGAASNAASAATNASAAQAPAAAAAEESAGANVENAGDNTSEEENAVVSDTAALQSGNAAQQSQTAPQSQTGQRKIRPEIVRLLSNFVTSARSGTIGGLSAISLIVIVILLFGAIENVFNDIWGVRRTRSWLTRVIFYWAILTLGTVIFSVAMGTLSAGPFINFFREELPFGPQVLMLFRFFLPVVGAVLAVLVLTLFYRFVPNTHVFWHAALAGAVTMCVLLVCNNMLAFAYFRRIEITRNLYGSLGVLLVLMLGMYIFWLIVLIGGHVSYAVQNVHLRNSQVAWNTLSHSTRERLTLLVLLTLARRFQACLPPCTVSELGDTINAPAQILNECLNRLVDMKLISPVPPPAKDEASSNFMYQPARPLSRITLGDFRELFENMGEAPSLMPVGLTDPVVQSYQGAVRSMNRSEFFSKTLDEAFAENPVAASALDADGKTRGQNA